MHIGIHYRFMRFHIITTRLLLISAACLISQHVFAQTDSGRKDAADIKPEQSANLEKDEKHLPVEAGSGGNINVERKYRTEMESLFDWHTHLLWESRYVSEGRDNLSGENLFSLSSDIIFDELTFIPWFARSPGADYSELNLNLVYAAFLTEKLAASIGYNHLRARYQDVDAVDNEISLDLGYKLMAETAVFASVYHSFEANGSFVEAGARYFGTHSKKIHYSVATSIGANAEYIPDGHNGLNHFQIRADVSYLPVLQMEFYGYAGYNQAINRDAVQYAGDELLDNFFWGGLGLIYLF